MKRLALWITSTVQSEREGGREELTREKMKSKTDLRGIWTQGREWGKYCMVFYPALLQLYQFAALQVLSCLIIVLFHIFLLPSYLMRLVNISNKNLYNKTCPELTRKPSLLSFKERDIWDTFIIIIIIV